MYVSGRKSVSKAIRGHKFLCGSLMEDNFHHHSEYKKYTTKLSQGAITRKRNTSKWHYSTKIGI